MTKTPSTLSKEEIEAIVGGFHGDPYAVLGPHRDEQGVVIRAFLPHAVEARVVLSDGSPAVDMEMRHKGGLFEVHLNEIDLPVDYHIQLVDHDDNEVLYEDPYAYPLLLSEYDEYLIAEGTHERIYEVLGAHLTAVNGRHGVRFAVWAPNALRVSVIGDFNQWDGRRHAMRFLHNSGIWEIFVPGLSEGAVYKYEIKTRQADYTVKKADPLAFFSEVRPATASIVWDIQKYHWGDDDWIATRASINHAQKPINIYEVHLGAWRRKTDNQWLSYSDLSEQLIPYVKEMGYTHIELMPIAEHPYDGSWGYQVTGYYAVTSRYGSPDEFKAFVDACHQNNIGVILDWVPAHFPRDEHGLAYFDGTFLYEHADPRMGAHPDWGTLIFNYGRTEVQEFLVGNALFWIDKYHIDGLRVDAVASMLYLDFSREGGEWIPNRYGGRENLDAIGFLKRFNERIHANFPGVLTIAEESTAWPAVTRLTADGGLGFDFKWNMGWMHDTLQYMSNETIHRSYHHGTLTFSLLYAFSERFVLPFSHDEVVHLKRSMLDKMPGDVWQKFANLRALLAYQIAHPGKKLLFMGAEFGQWREWTEAQSLDWHVLEGMQEHLGLQTLVRDANHFYKTKPALFLDDNSWEGFEWLDLHDAQRSILAFARHAPGSNESILVVCNFTPVVRDGYRLGVPNSGEYQEILNTDAAVYGGSGVQNTGPIPVLNETWHNKPYSIEIRLPPLGVVFLERA